MPTAPTPRRPNYPPRLSIQTRCISGSLTAMPTPPHQQQTAPTTGLCLSVWLSLSLSLSFCCVTDFLHVYANLNYVIYIFYDIHLLLIVQQEKVAQGSHHSPAHNSHNWLDQHYSISIYLDNLVQSILFTK